MLNKVKEWISSPKKEKDSKIYTLGTSTFIARLWRKIPLKSISRKGGWSQERIIRMPKEHNGCPSVSESRESACNTGDPGLILGLGRSSGKRNGNSLQYSCLENPGTEQPWREIVHRVAKSGTRLKQLST